MAVDDVLDDGEAQPGAADRARAARVHPVEPLGQPRQVLARNARPVDRRPSAPRRAAPASAARPPARPPAAPRPPSRPYFTALSSRFCTTCASWSASPSTGGNPSASARSSVTPRSASRGSNPAARPAQQLGQIDPLRRRLVLGQLDARQAEQVVDQPVHPRRLLRHDAEEALLRRRVVGRRAAQRLDEADQPGQRRAQLVAGIGDEVGAHAFHRALARAVRQHHDGPPAVGAAAGPSAPPSRAARAPPAPAAG